MRSAIIAAMAPVPHHRSEVFGSPWKGVYCTHIESSRHFGKHWHAVYGLGLLVQGAQRSASARGPVEAFAGDLITTNPGEVHDGQPLGVDTRRWRMVYIEPEVLQPQGEPDACAAGVDLVRPVIQDAALAQVLATLLDRIACWSTHRPRGAAAADELACEESLAQVTALLLQRHASTPALSRDIAARGPAPSSQLRQMRQLRQVREWLADNKILDPEGPGEMLEPLSRRKPLLSRLRPHPSHKEDTKLSGQTAITIAGGLVGSALLAALALKRRGKRG